MYVMGKFLSFFPYLHIQRGTMKLKWMYEKREISSENMLSKQDTAIHPYLPIHMYQMTFKISRIRVTEVILH